MSKLEAIEACRACDSPRLEQFLDLGEQYLSDFREDESKPPKYPLVAALCVECDLVQLMHTTPQEEMYHDRYGFKSGVSDSIKADLDDIVTHGFQYVNDPKSWLDIASNDGTLLNFVPDLDGGWKVGVDPVGFLCDEAQKLNPHAMIINDYFSRDVVPFDDHHFDVITSISCFYDMPDPRKFVEDVKQVLAPRGVWIIQQNYLLTTMELDAVDNFCHEHLEYYTLKSLENLLSRFDLEVVEVSTSMVNGGSLRTVVAHKGAFEVDDTVYIQREREANYGVEDPETYHDFASRIGNALNKLRNLILDMKAQGKSVAILAASTRGATIWQSAELNQDLIDYAVERNPAKVGKYFSAIGVPIISEEEFRERQPDAAIIGPWFFQNEFVAREAEYLRKGGSLIVPLPEVEVKVYNSAVEEQDERSRNTTAIKTEHSRA